MPTLSADRLGIFTYSHLKKKYKTLMLKNILVLITVSEGLQFDGSVASSPPPVSSPVFAHSPVFAFSSPIDRMPFGLLSYNIQYFSSDTVNNLRADSDYIN